MALPNQKYDFSGIGKGSALLLFTALAAGSGAFLTQGIVGSVIFWLATKFFSYMASLGLILVNVGVANVQTLSQQKEFDGTFDDAFRIINSKKITKEEGDAIDNKVIAVFRKFARFGELSKPPG